MKLPCALPALFSVAVLVPASNGQTPPPPPVLLEQMLESASNPLNPYGQLITKNLGKKQGDRIARTVMDSAGELPAEWSEAWFKVLKGLGIDAAADGPLMPALYTRGLPKVGEQEVRDRYLARLKSLTPATVDEWMKAARLFVGRRRGLLVHLLVQYDPLFVGSELRAASAAELQKLHSIPTLALRYWGDFTNNRRRANYYSNGLELALSLMSVPALFTDGSFDQKLFETAIGVRGGRR